MNAEYTLQYSVPQPDEDGNRGQRTPDHTEYIEVHSITELMNVAWGTFRKTQSDPTLVPAENVTFNLL